MLLRARGEVVSVARLSEGLWGDEPPDGAPTTLRTYISRLRAVCGSDARITASADGYAIAAPPDRVDELPFERLVQGSGIGARRSRVRSRGRTAEKALGLWRGRPLGASDEAIFWRADPVDAESSERAVYQLDPGAAELETSAG